VRRIYHFRLRASALGVLLRPACAGTLPCFRAVPRPLRELPRAARGLAKKRRDCGGRGSASVLARTRVGKRRDRGGRLLVGRESTSCRIFFRVSRRGSVFPWFGGSPVRVSLWMPRRLRALCIFACFGIYVLRRVGVRAPLTAVVRVMDECTDDNCTTVGVFSDDAAGECTGDSCTTASDFSDDAADSDESCLRLGGQRDGSGPVPVGGSDCDNSESMSDSRVGHGCAQPAQDVGPVLTTDVLNAFVFSDAGLNSGGGVSVDGNPGPASGGSSGWIVCVRRGPAVAPVTGEGTVAASVCSDTDSFFARTASDIRGGSGASASYVFDGESVSGESSDGGYAGSGSSAPSGADVESAGEESLGGGYASPGEGAGGLPGPYDWDGNSDTMSAATTVSAQNGFTFWALVGGD
jgi:hypothetical protein